MKTIDEMFADMSPENQAKARKLTEESGMSENRAKAMKVVIASGAFSDSKFYKDFLHNPVHVAAVNALIGAVRLRNPLMDLVLTEVMELVIQSNALAIVMWEDQPLEGVTHAQAARQAEVEDWHPRVPDSAANGYST